MALNVEREAIPQDVLSSVAFFIDHYPKHVLLRRSGIIAVNKPAGIAMSDRSAFFTSGIVSIAEDFETKPLKPVNRLDRDTSGVVLLAENRAAARALSRQFQERTVNKRYLALVNGDFPPALSGILAPLLEVSDADRMTVEVSMDKVAKFARTGVRLLSVMESKSGEVTSLVAVRLYTGRTHQIRVHLAALGYPIIGDSVYGNEAAESRQMLHSHVTEVLLPGEDLPAAITAPLPYDFVNYIRKQAVVAGQENITRLLV